MKKIVQNAEKEKKESEKYWKVKTRERRQEIKKRNASLLGMSDFANECQ